MNCPVCSKSLSESQYRGVYKSCPACSQNAGVHIFYKCPEAFGKTPLRATSNHPEGFQSHCENCRGGNVGPHLGALKCNQI